jgi:Flp pilus assembly protein TadG
MQQSHQRRSTATKCPAARSGQAMLEFASIATAGLLLLFGVIDIGRALYFMQVMSSLSRQGSNLASRGSTVSDSVAAVMAGQAPLNLTANGEVIVTSILNSNGVNTITGQASQGGIAVASKIGAGVGGLASVPSAALTMLQPNSTIYVTEVYYTYQPITPIGNLLGIVMPSTLYQAAYF